MRLEAVTYQEVTAFEKRVKSPKIIKRKELQMRK